MGGESKKLTMEFLSEEKNRTVDSSLELPTMQQLNRVVDSRHSELSTAFHRELGFVRVSTAYCFWANPSRFSNLFLIQIRSFWFPFLKGNHAYIKRGNCP